MYQWHCIRSNLRWHSDCFNPQNWWKKAELSSSTDKLSCFVFSSLWLLSWSNCVAHFKLFSEGSASHINCAIDSNSTSWNSGVAGKMSFWNYANSWKFRHTDSPSLHLLHIIRTSDNCSLMTSLHSFGVKELDQPLEAILQLPMSQSGAKI